MIQHTINITIQRKIRHLKLLSSHKMPQIVQITKGTKFQMAIKAVLHRIVLGRDKFRILAQTSKCQKSKVHIMAMKICEMNQTIPLTNHLLNTQMAVPTNQPSAKQEVR